MKLENDKYRINFKFKHGILDQNIKIKTQKGFIPVLRNFNNKNIINFSNKPLYFSAIKGNRNPNNFNFIIKSDSDIDIEFIPSIDNEENTIYEKYVILFHKKKTLSKILAEFEICLGNQAGFVWVPHLRPKQKYVIGDHIFRSPVIIYSSKTIACALIPDLDELKENRRYPTYLNLEIYSKNEKNPYLSYGFGKYKPVKHVFFKKQWYKKMKFKKGDSLTFGYYIKLFHNKSRSELIKTINSFLWIKYGKKLLRQNLNPQILPYNINVQEGLKAIFKRHEYWGNFYINNKKCGGIWQRSWLGKKKAPLEYVEPKDLASHKKARMKEIVGTKSILGKIIINISFSPKTIKFFDKFTRNYPIVRRVAEVWNNAWFLNIRTGFGIKLFGIVYNDNDLIEKGNRILNTLLNLPRKRGLFPSVILPATKNAQDFSFINGVKGFRYDDEFHLVDCSLAMYWALKYYQYFEKNELINDLSLKLINTIKEIQLDNGAIPTYLRIDDYSEKPFISEKLINSASSGASMMFILEYYKIMKEKDLILMAKRIAKFIHHEILPKNKWQDFEPFYSCTNLPLKFYDKFTENNVMNCLSIYWCAEGFKELYKITKNSKYLKIGEHILGLLSLFQQVWNLPYIDYNTFGGFGAQNADAELGDARQGLFVRTYMDYYLLTGNKEYMERGIAALRACWALQLLEEYKDQCPGNLLGIDSIKDIDKGCVNENYGHSGIDFRTPGYEMFDWGIGTSIMATAYVKYNFGDLFIDFKEQAVWGIDGLLIEEYNFSSNIIEIYCKIILNKKNIIIKARNIPENLINIKINNQLIKLRDNNQLKKGFIFTI